MQESRHGTHLVRADVRPHARQDAVVVADAYQSVVGTHGSGDHGRHRHLQPPRRRAAAQGQGHASRDGRTLIPGSLEDAFILDGPGEYEVKDVLMTGVRTYRDDSAGQGARPQRRVRRRAGRDAHDPPRRHRPSADRGEADATSGRSTSPASRSAAALSPNRAAELVAQLDAEDRRADAGLRGRGDCDEALAKFFHEMGGTAAPAPSPSCR